MMSEYFDTGAPLKQMMLVENTTEFHGRDHECCR
jgi:hypothetical protein